MKIYEKWKILLIVGCSLWLLGCATTRAVVIDYDREADFSQYHTYYWSDEFQMRNGSSGQREPLFYNTLNKKRLKQAIEDAMNARGYTLSDNDPDLLVHAQVVVQQTSNDRHYTPYPYYSFYYPGPYYSRQSANDKQGDIVIELIDPDEQQLVWQGYAGGVLDTSTEDREQEIRDAVDLIFSEYGRRAGQSGPPPEK